MNVPVWVEAWQHQCCGEPFGVGSTVAWTLTVDEEDFARQALGSRAPDWSAVLPVLGPVQPPEPAPGGVVVGAEGLHVFVPDGSALAPAPGQDGVRVHLLREDHHGDVPDGVPPTRGRVRRLRLVRHGYEYREDVATWYPRPDDVALQDVPTAERWPQDCVDGRRFAGFLVDLDVESDGAPHGR